MGSPWSYIPEARLKFIIWMKKFINFMVILFVILFFWREIYNYSENVEYFDERNVVKYHDFWYAVYDKDNKLKEIYFYEWFWPDKWFDIVSYIKKNMVLQNDEDLLVKIMKKESSWNENFVKIFWMEKQEIVEMAWYKIKWLYRTDNEDQFVLTYVHELKWTNRYCFAINSLSMDDSKNYCIDKVDSNLPMNILWYDEYYFITIDKQIFVFSKNMSKIISIINWDSSIIWMSSNKEGDIKLKTVKGTKEIRSVIIEYYVIRRLQWDNVDMNKLILNNL